MADRITPEIAGPKGVGIGAPFAPEPHEPIAGDWTDDDGRTLDDYFEPNPQGPNLVSVESPLTVPATYDDTAPKVTRLITRSVPVGQPMGVGYTAPSVTADPILLMPADPRRKRIRIRAGLLPDIITPLATPAAGANPVLPTVPNGFRLTPSIISASMTANATVATRVPLLGYVNPSGTVFFDTGTAIQASTTRTWVWSLNVGTAYLGSTGSYIRDPLPARSLSGGESISFSTINLQVGDQWSNIFLVSSDYSYRVAGEKSDCYGAVDLPASTVWESEEHTGPIWVYAPYSAGQFTLIAESVSE